MNDVDTGALGPSGRFARMEAALDRIELKLDLKADMTRVVELEARHAALELSISRMVSGETTSPLGQLYLQRFNEMESSIEDLKTKDQNREAVALAVKSDADRRYGTLLWIVGVASLFNVGLALMVALRTPAG
jgi:hypothetical protein